MSVAIHPYRNADAEAVSELYRRCAEHDSTVSRVPVDQWRSFVALPFNRDGRDFALAWLDGQMVGLLTSAALQATAERSLRHVRVLVAPRLRRRGIGGALIHHARAQPLDGPRPTLQANVPLEWAAGVAFCEHLGARVVHRDLRMARNGGADPAPEPPEGVHLREAAGAADMALKATLHNLGYSGTPHFEQEEPADAEKHANQPGFRLWFAELDGTVVGFVQTRHEGESSGLLESVVVLDQWRGRGLGRLLVLQGLATLAEQGRVPATLNVDDRNVGAVGLYESLGFERCGGAATYQVELG